MTKIPDIIWCEVPAGEFIMGSDNDYKYEKPQHIVNIPYSYKVSKYIVTNVQYNLFVQAGGYTERRYWTEAGWWWKEKERWIGPRFNIEPYNPLDEPVIGVSWYETVAYCRWLTEQLRKQGNLTHDWQIRLPTEAEWEKAARGTDGRIYPWGNEFDPNKANCDEIGINFTTIVGFFPQGVSPYGCHDMAGNVWEWCATTFGKPYPYQI